MATAPPQKEHVGECYCSDSELDRYTRPVSPTLTRTGLPSHFHSDSSFKPPRKPRSSTNSSSDSEADDSASSADSSSSLESEWSSLMYDTGGLRRGWGSVMYPDDTGGLRRGLHLLGPVEDDIPKTVEVPPFPVGEMIYSKENCIVCLIESNHPALVIDDPGSGTRKQARFRACCSKFVCSPCLEEYCSVKVNDGIVHIGCPNSDCMSYLHRDEIAFHLKTESLKEKFYKFLIDANKDPLTKTCPRCCHVTRVKSSELKSRKRKYGLKKRCPECELVWCFPCQAPWHESMTCRQYCAGDKLVAEWAREVHYGSRNAQKCPKCLVYIERTEGCDHMSCGYCQTDFCYRCGGRYRSLPFLGSHHSRYSVFGCKYYLKPNKPAQRIFIRSSVLGGKILAVPALLTVGVALLPFALMAGAVVAPVYGGIALHRYLKKRRKKMPSCQRKWRNRGERAPVVLLRVGHGSVVRREGVVFPPCELTSHFESELDSTQMNEIRADLDDLHLQSLMEPPPRPYESFPPTEADLTRRRHRRRRRADNSNPNWRERVRGTRLKRRTKLPSKFDIPDPDNPNTDIHFDSVDLFNEIKPRRAASTSKDVSAASLTHVDVHSDVSDVSRKDSSAGGRSLESVQCECGLAGSLGDESEACSCQDDDCDVAEILGRVEQLSLEWRRSPNMP